MRTSVVHNGNGQIRLTWVGGVFSSRPEDAGKPEMLIDKRLSLFGQYIKTAGIYRCPSDKSTVIVRDPISKRMTPKPRLRSYCTQQLRRLEHEYPGRRRTGLSEPA